MFSRPWDFSLSRSIHTSETHHDTDGVAAQSVTRPWCTSCRVTDSPSSLTLVWAESEPVAPENRDGSE